MKKAAVWLMAVMVVLAGFGLAQQRVLRLDNSAPGELDPHKGNDYSGSILAYNIYDTLVMPDPQTGVKPHLATRWTASNGGRTYTFNLRPNVRFHDGTLVQADDVVFSFERVKALDQGFAFLFAGWVTSVQAVNSATVRFNLSGVYAPFLSTLVRLPIVNKDLVLRNKRDGRFGNNGDYGQAFLSSNDAGSGAYRVVSHNPQELTVLQKFPQYFLGFAPKAPDVVRQRYSVESATMRTLMVRREHDISSQWHPQEVFKALAGQQGINLITEGGSGSLMFKLNTQRAPTDDVNFRKAMALAFDYEALRSTLKITDTISSGKPARGPLPAGVPSYDSSIPFPKRDVAAARAALARSKYANQLSSIVIDMAWVAEVPSEEKMALLFQQNMAELGVKVNITKVPWASLTERFAKAETTPNLYPLFTGLSYPDPDGLLYVMYSSKAAGTFWSSSWLKDDQIDKMLDEARTTADNAKRMEMYKQIQRRLVDLQTDIFGYDNLAVFAKQANIKVPTLEDESKSVSTTGANWLFRLMEIE
ncbi:MAG: ABC transporter substrate-binding protein [Meiothermus sp.]|nr:ABC transporter substrate-binding protein [Meiothermus sp.]